MSDASLTNLQMVRPKGPKIFLGVLGLAVVGAAAWWFTRPAGPVGAPDDPGKILVVGPDAADTATTLRDFGFDTEHGAYDDLAAEGAGKAPGKEGIEAILHLADERGFGYVAIEDPATHGMESILVTGDSADVTSAHTWAVFSVGDLGMPPKVTVDIEQTVMPLPDYVQVLRAAFKQDRLANTLFSESRLPIDAQELHAKIKIAVDLHGSYAMLDRRLDKEQRSRKEAIEDAETIDPKPAVLARPMETTETIALGDGTVLTFVQGYRLDSPRDADVSLQPSPEIELWYYPPGSTELTERKRCDSLRGGLLAVGGTHHVMSAAADALLLQSTGALELFSLDLNAKACAFTRKGKIPLDGEYERTWGVPHASGKLLRPATPPDGLAVNVWTAGEESPQVVSMPGCTHLGDPAWFDEGHFAISCRYEPPEPEIDYSPDLDDPFADEDEEPEEVEPPPPPLPEQTWIYVVRIADARILALPGTALGEHTGTYGLHPIPHSKTLDLVLTHPWADKLHRVGADGDLTAMFTAAEPTFAQLAEADAAAAVEAEAAAAAAIAEAAAATAQQAPPPSGDAPLAGADGERPAAAPEAEPAPLLRPAFVPIGATVVALAPETLKISSVDLPDSANEMSFSPDGTKVVYIPGNHHTVNVWSLDGSTNTVVSDNPEASHTGPRFTADGKAVIFTSEYSGTDRPEQVGRYVTLK